MAPAWFQEAWPTIRFGEIDSTNEEARRRALAGEMEPSWLLAERQSAGRGRLGRRWESSSGNLFATALFVFPGPAAAAALVSFAAGLALIEAVDAVGADAEGLRLKWPNDVLANEAKLAGVLIETLTVNGALVMAAGFGMNVAAAPDLAERRTACVRQLPGGESASVDRLISALDVSFRRRLSLLLSAGFEPIRADWMAKAAYLGARIVAPQGEGRVEGVMDGLSEDGSLVIRRDNGTLTHVRAGEISVFS